MKKKTLLLIAMFSMACSLSAQETKQWTLQDCIDYALEKNIQLQQNRNAVEESEIDVKTANAELFPSLSFSTGHNIVNRPYQENSSTVSGTEIIESDSKTTYNGSYSLSANWTVWNGGRNTKNVKQQKVNREIANLQVDEYENTLKEEITKLFVQILYTAESIKINEETVETSTATYNRAKELFAEGSISKADLAQLEASKANDEYNLVVSKNSLRSYKLQLKQYLEIDGAAELNLALPELSDEDVLEELPNQMMVYQTALEARPEIRSGMLSIDNAKLAIDVAKAGYYPTVSLSASSSSSTNSASSSSWASQMKYGWNNMIGLNLSIPIFDNRQNKSNVQKAKIEYNNSLLDLQSKQKTLYSDIESLYIEAYNAQQQYRASQVSVNSSQTSFDMVNEQFTLGMKNTVELLTEKNNLLSAQQQRVQAKYMAILNRTLLNFYAGTEISL